MFHIDRASCGTSHPSSKPCLSSQNIDSTELPCLSERIPTRYDVILYLCSVLVVPVGAILYQS